MGVFAVIGFADAAIAEGSLATLEPLAEFSAADLI